MASERKNTLVGFALFVSILLDVVAFLRPFEWAFFFISGILLAFYFHQMKLESSQNSDHQVTKHELTKAPNLDTEIIEEDIPEDVVSIPSVAFNAPFDADSEVIRQLPTFLRFVDAMKGDQEQGLQRIRATLQWRQENGIDHILLEPQPRFHQIKNCYSSFYHKHSLEGHALYFEQPTKADLAGLQANEINVPMLVRHYMFQTEFLYRVLHPYDRDGKCVTVVDLEGLGIGDIGGDPFAFFRAASALCQQHYPERCAKTFLINCTRTFSFIWRMIKPFIDPITLSKIQVLGYDYQQTLLQELGPQNVPRMFGGTCNTCEHGDCRRNSREEKRMRRWVEMHCS